jgi:hypothetical protein
MNLFDVIRDVRRLLAENGRISQRMLRKQFQLDDEALEGERKQVTVHPQDPRPRQQPSTPTPAASAR